MSIDEQWSTSGRRMLGEVDCLGDEPGGDAVFAVELRLWSGSERHRELIVEIRSFEVRAICDEYGDLIENEVIDRPSTFVMLSDVEKLVALASEET